jgi:hypothetical protein
MTMYPEKKFSSPTPVFLPPMKATDIPDEWCADVRKIIARDGYPVRARTCTNGDHVIEAKSLTTNVWHPLGLPNSSGRFATAEDRDIIFAKLTGK